MAIWRGLNGACGQPARPSATAATRGKTSIAPANPPPKTAGTSLTHSQTTSAPNALVSRYMPTVSCGSLPDMRRLPAGNRGHVKESGHRRIRRQDLMTLLQGQRPQFAHDFDVSGHVSARPDVTAFPTALDNAGRRPLRDRRPVYPQQRAQPC